MKIWLALMRKEFDEHRNFLMAVAGGTVLLEGYAAFTVSAHLGAALLAFLPLWAILLLLPFRLIQSLSLERRGQTHHLLLSLPVARAVPFMCKTLVLLAAGAVVISVALAGIYVVCGQVEGMLRLPGLPQVSSEDVVAFSGMGAMATLILSVGAALAVDGVRTSLNRFRWVGTAGFMIVMFITYLYCIPAAMEALGALALLGEGLGRAYFTYNALFGVLAGGSGLFLIETLSEA